MNLKKKHIPILLYDCHSFQIFSTILTHLPTLERSIILCPTDFCFRYGSVNLTVYAVLDFRSEMFWLWCDVNRCRFHLRWKEKKIMNNLWQWELKKKDKFKHKWYANGRRFVNKIAIANKIGIDICVFSFISPNTWNDNEYT